jgi:hypothetical protein
MTTEWADDRGTFGRVDVRCVAPMPRTEDDGDERGCGWEARAMTVTQYGTMSVEYERCPICGGQIEVR